MLDMVVMTPLRWTPFAVRLIACFASGIGVVALAGWTTGNDHMRSVIAHRIAMNPTTAVCFMIASVALWALSKQELTAARGRIARGCAGALAVVAALRIAASLTPWDSGIDQWLFAESLQVATPGPNRMAPHTALAMLCISATIVLLTVRTVGCGIAALAVAVAVALLGTLALVGHANGVLSFFGISSSIGMAVNTAMACISIALAVMMIAWWRITAPRGPDERSLGDRLVLAGFASASAVMTVVSITAYASTSHFVADDRMKNEVQEVIAAERDLALALKSAESSMRGYVISEDEIHLVPYMRATARTRELGPLLRQVTEGTKRQQEHLDALEPLVAAKIEWMDGTLELCLADFDAARSRVATGVGQRVMDQILDRLAVMEQEERELLKERSAAADAGATASVIVVTLGSLLGIGIVGVSGLLIRRDMGRRHAAEEFVVEARRVAEAANRAKSEFVAHMSHEVRTPLNGVIGMTDLLLSTPLTEQQRHYADLVKTSAESLTTVLNDILDFSKIEAGKLEIVESDFNLHTTVENIVETMASRASAKGLQMECMIHRGVPMHVRGDCDRLRQVLINLINNATKFTERGSVSVRVVPQQVTAGSVMIKFLVQDTGIGIAPDRIDRLFKSFSQADASTTRVYGGTGLGLVISKRLAELLGGAIGVESVLGKGSTFWFTAVFQRLAAEAANEDARQIEPANLRVLVVKGEDAQCDLLAEQVQGWGMQMASADDADSAIQLLLQGARQQRPFHVAIVSGDLEDGGAVALAARVREEPEIQDTVMMMVLASGTSFDLRRFEQLGFAGCLMRPLRQSKLFDAIVNAIARGKMVSGAAAERRSRTSATRSPLGDGVAASNAASSAHSELKPMEQDQELGRGLKVLVAEDNAVNQILAIEMLRRLGFTPEVVADGRSAVEAARSGRFCAVLMDCQMPVMDGYEASRTIRQYEAAEQLGAAGGRLPIIALTANAMKGDRERCLDAGMDDYLSKPIRAEHLKQAMERGLSLRRNSL